MDADDVLKALGRLAAQQRADEPPWLRAAAEGHAHAGAVPASEAALHAHVTAVPTEAELDRLLARRRPAARGPAATPAPVPGPTLAARWRRFAALFALPSLALAAAVFLFARPRGAARLPQFAAEITGASTERGSTPNPTTPSLAPIEPPLQVAPNTQVQVLLRPQTAVAGPVAARAFFAAGDRWLPWLPQTDVSPEGSVRMRGPAPGELPAGSRARLEVFVGRPEALEGAPQALGARTDVQRFTRDVLVR